MNLEFELQTLINALLLVSASYLAAQWWRQNRFVKASVRGIDPVGEAEVFLFQGKVKEAIRVLKGALEDEPDDLSIKVALLRAYGEAGQAERYDQLAKQVAGKLKHESIWEQIKKTGKLISPKNKLYE
ncbi:type IV pilus assembly protein FimV [Laribacter hongkongensis]|uniref:FimV n=1 Tax=Laribacter hongkongensis TaxID=168471 RepID=A0A248LN20_9NEIS|nr:pilus assembly protein FimV [Laribacter hongkongensis]ASJ25965.1 FimV [Laribacter hongkongensis]MCG9040025.1 pilus assembly protein FimV [Laribacter hongkongensis]MCG9058944.1 pilus assembly protein FimV [Laribacter hongkongensis]MCG9068300.1 pilus assembly protein FimV [Laribacter hongkongensis]MCG9077654.1 pilus assembly protein FimV [Laribacter hongkongensis]